MEFCSNPWCWAGVEVGVGDVQGLSLAGNQLQGDLPGPSLAALKGLVTLDLSNNEIEGAFSQSIPMAARFRPLMLLREPELCCFSSCVSARWGFNCKVDKSRRMT